MFRTRSTIAALLCLAFASGASAQVNDNWANRTEITTLPFHVKETQLDSATHEQTDPAPPCGGVGNTLWYGFTTGGSPAYLSLVLSPVADVEGAVLGTVAVYSGTPGAFKLVNGACASDTGNLQKGRLFGVRLEPNTAYSIEIGNAAAFGPGQRIDLTVSASPTYTVTKIADTADGMCSVGDCSLREAISAANSAPGAVLVPAGTYTLGIAGENDNLNATGDLDVNAGMGIYGAGMDTTTIDANHIDRVLDVHGNTLNPLAAMVGDLTLANGTLTSMLSPREGGGLNAALGDGDFIGIERVKFIGNSAFQGGGGARLTKQGMVSYSHFTGNSTFSNGGGLALLAFQQGNYFDVIGCTFDDNTSTSGFGGGIDAYGTVRVANSTFSGNHAAFGGAGINAGGNAPIVLRSSTIVFNEVTAFGAQGAGLRLDTSNGSNEISNNVIAGNTSDPDDDNDCYNDGSAMSTHHNHVQRNNNCSFTGTGDVLGTNPLVDPALANNGGPTPTHALDPLSPVLDTADPTGCVDGAGLPLEFDQRGAGFPRRSGMVCDKGAFERTSNTVFYDGFETPLP